MTTPFTLLHDGQSDTIEASISRGDVRIAPELIHQALGWKLEPEGLCKAGMCVPVPVGNHGELVGDDGIDLAGLAKALDSPLALDLTERAGALGTPAFERGAMLESLEAPDFSLPDLAGRMHSLSDHRGKKVLLIAYASW